MHAGFSWRWTLWIDRIRRALRRRCRPVARPEGLWRLNGFKPAEDEVHRAVGRGRRARQQGVAPQPVRMGPDPARDRGDHRHRHLRAHRHGGGQPGRAGDHDVVSVRRAGLRVRGAVLRRVRLDDSDRRQRLHLRLRDHGRVVRVDHRLGPHPRVRSRVDDRGDRLERLHAEAARGRRHRAAGVDDARRRAPTRRERSSTCRR